MAHDGEVSDWVVAPVIAVRDLKPPSTCTRRQGCRGWPWSQSIRCGIRGLLEDAESIEVESTYSFGVLGGIHLHQQDDTL